MSDNLRFEDLPQLTDREIQILFSETDQKDLVTALKGASDKFKGKFLGNMSRRVRGFIEAEIGSSDVTDDAIEEAQLRLVQLVEKLGEQGQIALGQTGQAASKQRPKLGKEYREAKRQLTKLTKRSMLDLGYDEIDELFVGFGETARREGILALEKMLRGSDEDFLMARNLARRGRHRA